MEPKRIASKVDQVLSLDDEFAAQLRDRQTATEHMLATTINSILDDTPRSS